MVDIKTLSIGDKIYWVGGSPTETYGHRRVEATVLIIKDEKRIQIKIETPKGTILKYVSKASIMMRE